MAKQSAAGSPATERNDEAPSEFATSLHEYIRGGYQCLYIPTSEEHRLETEITKVAELAKMAFVTWDCAKGFSVEELASQAKYRQPAEALRALEDPNIFKAKDVIFVFRDLDDYFQVPEVRRLIRSLCEGNKLSNKVRWRRMLIITSPRLDIHKKLKSHVTTVEFNLPDEIKLRKVFDFVKKSVTSADPTKLQHTPELADQVVAGLLGLTSKEAEDTISRCLVRHGGYCPEMLTTIKAEKAAIIKQSEVLTFIPDSQMVTRDQIGGYENLLAFIDRRKLAYMRDARAINLDLPKGIVLLGVPGSGKSMVASAVARLLGLPGYIMDVGSVFGSLVGESEARLREALHQVEAQKGCVLLLDEADKALGGAHESSGDSGVTKRVFGQLLSWLSNKNDRTFVIMTMNRTKGIPPEFLRAGRFDAIFYTDLPSSVERRQILEIHLKKRGVDPAAMGLEEADWKDLIEDRTKDWVGSEIEELVRESRYLAWENRRAAIPTHEELVEAAAGIIPLAQRAPDEIAEIRTYCEGKAKPVSLRKQRHRPSADRSRAVNVDE